MTDLENAIARFQALVDETPGVWQSIDVRAIATTCADAESNLLCIARLDCRAPSDYPSSAHLPIVPPIVCRQMVVPFARLHDLLTQLRNGALAFDERVVSFRKRPSHNGGGPEPPYSSCYTSRATELLSVPNDAAFSIGHLLVARGDSNQEVFRGVVDGLEGLNNALRRAERPWDGVDSLTRHGLRTRHRIDYNTTSTLEVVAPLEARLDAARCTLRDGAFLCTILAAAQLKPFLRLGIFGAHSDGVVFQDQIDLSSAGDWRSDGERVRWEGTFVWRDTGRVTLFLSVGNSSIDRLEVVDLSASTTNPRISGYSLVDPKLELLRKRLTPSPGRDSALFERAVARVFTFAGFVTDGYAFEKGLTNGPDALAYAPDGSTLLVIECTTGPLSSKEGKMSQLIARTARVRDRCAQSVATVLPVIVSSLPRGEFADFELTAAATDRVCVLGREDVLALLELCVAQVSTQQVVSFCLARIPKRSDLT